MATMKWDISGKGDPVTQMGNYSGPNLPRGSYVARIKRATVGKIKAAGDNQGKPRISILLEVVGGAETGGKPAADPQSYQYYRAPVWDGLNIIKSGTSFVNAFLHALSDGSEAGHRDVEHAFWDLPKKVEREERPDGSKVVHLKSFGKYVLNSPNGEMLVQVTTRAGADLNGNYRPEVTGYMPYKGPGQKAAIKADDEDADQELLDSDDDDGEEDDELDDDDNGDEDDEDELYDDEEGDGEGEPYTSDEVDARETATSGSRTPPPF